MRIFFANELLRFESSDKAAEKKEPDRNKVEHNSQYLRV